MSISRLTELHEPRSATPATQETTNAYLDVAGSKLDTLALSNVVYTIKNTDAVNSLDWKVLASIDDTTYIEVQAEATVIATGSSSYTATNTPYRYFKVQVKATVGGAQGDAQVRGYAKH